MIKITMLGTSGSTPTRERNLSSMALEFDGKVYLFDCGEGTQRQCMLYSINISRIESIFVTHMHGDHVIGLAGLVRTMALNRRLKPLHIYVPKGEESKVMALITFDKAMIGYKIIVTGIKPGPVCSGEGFSVRAFKLNHTVPTYGYVFEQEGKRRFIKEKAKKLGLKGEMFKKLAAKGSIKIKNKTIRLNDVTYPVEAKRIVYATDTRPAETTVSAAKGAQLLIHEATYSSKLNELALERSHSTSLDAARIAKKAKCEKLLLFHMSARYRNTAELLNEARKVFKNTEIAKDGLVITL
jgi:ribonuclease Z